MAQRCFEELVLMHPSLVSYFQDFSAHSYVDTTLSYLTTSLFMVKDLKVCSSFDFIHDQYEGSELHLLHHPIQQTQFDFSSVELQFSMIVAFSRHSNQII